MTSPVGSNTPQSANTPSARPSGSYGASINGLNFRVPGPGETIHAPAVASWGNRPIGDDYRKAWDSVAAQLNTQNPIAIRTEVERQLYNVQGLDAYRTATPTQTPANAGMPSGGGSSSTELGLDLTQLVLDITGVIEPTPFSDGSNTVISLGRSIGSAWNGNWGDTGGHLFNGGLSALGIIPYLGDAAKAGKIGKWAQTVSDAVSAIARNPALRETLGPALRQIHELVGKIPQSALDSLPAGARESLERMKSQLDEFVGAATRTFDQGIVNVAERLGIPPQKVQDIIDAGRGNRPAPSTYMSSSQIIEHLAKFDDGAVRFTLRSGAEKYGTLGPQGGFTMPASEFNQLLEETGGNLARVEQKLGLDAGTLASEDTLIALIDRADATNLRIPSGNEGGANAQWIPGGVTSGGVSEAVMDFTASTPYNEIRLR